MEDDKKDLHSIFSNQDPDSGGYGEREEDHAKPTKPRTSAASKTKKKKKNKSAKLSRKKSRK
ncbi:MAG TPA: hypothetical protein EYG28_01865 [Nitrospiria bacterium]|nr:hypothetical protein [Candidatus Manganitrophaceae bacterium]HIL34143.1 hypothetical protein [Candidatus Manganitrophaceae bacterium]